MKVKHSIFALSFMLITQSGFAQESTVSAEVAKPEVVTEASIPETPKFNDYSKGFLSRFGFFVGVAPIPVLSGGISVGGEFLLAPWFSLTGSYDRLRTSTDGVTDYSTYEESSRVISKSTSLGVRLYNGLSQRWWKGFYLSSGYKWANLDTKFDPAIFGGPVATRLDTDQGIYGGVGYRFTADLSARTTLLLDIGLSYEPGAIKDVVYSAYFGSSPNQSIKTEVGYRTFPQAKMGLRF